MWLKMKDFVDLVNHNTRFFHRLTNSHRKNNFISYLSINSTFTSDQVAINDTIIQFYNNLFMDNSSLLPQIRWFEVSLVRLNRSGGWRGRFKRKSFKCCLVWMGDNASGLGLYYCRVGL